MMIPTFFIVRLLKKKMKAHGTLGLRMACPLVQCAQTVGKYIFRVHVVLHFKTVRPRKTVLLSLFSIARTMRGCQETGGIRMILFTNLYH